MKTRLGEPMVFRLKGVALLIGVLLIVAGTPAASAAERPAGFWYGTDSWPMSVGGAGPYREPAIGGGYGGYMGMIGSWEWWLGCHGRFLAWSNTNSAQADTNLSTYHQGVGTGAYWFMGGPGVDPRYNGTAAEAYAWGATQAARALSDIRRLPHSRRVSYPIVWMDVERPLITPAPDNGWDSVYTSPCSGAVKSTHIAPAVDRAEFNGFWDYISQHSSYRPGVYSDPVDWGRIFGPGSAGSVPNTDEWTYQPETASLGQAPSGWCLIGGGCAHFFGGVTSASAHALMWQWSGGGGVRNGYGDFDQIDAARPG